MILAADIGGTKTLVGLFDGAQCIVQRRLTAADFSDFASALAVFLDENPGHTITHACFALAGPVARGQQQAQLTNLPWVIDTRAIGQRFALPQARLVNDFAAAAMGAVSAGSTELTELHAGTPVAEAPRLVVGAGTGLGVALALPQGNGQGWRIVPGEGGHVAFAPANAEQLALWQYLHQRHGRVTWERVVSGPGLAAIYQSLSGTILTPEAVVTKSRTDAAAAHALELFFSAYGAFAGDMALLALAQGGVYLAGGIASTLLPQLQASLFMTAFQAKAEHADLARKMPVRVVTDPAIGLRGAALLAVADC